MSFTSILLPVDIDMLLGSPSPEEREINKKLIKKIISTRRILQDIDEDGNIYGMTDEKVNKIATILAYSAKKLLEIKIQRISLMEKYDWEKAGHG